MKLAARGGCLVRNTVGLVCGRRRPQLMRDPLGGHTNIGVSVALPEGLHESARTFAALLVARHPEWEPHLRTYQPDHPADDTEPGSLWLEVSEVIGGRSTPVSLTVQSTEALLRVGDRERLFVWPGPERDAAHAEVLVAVDTALT